MQKLLLGAFALTAAVQMASSADPDYVTRLEKNFSVKHEYYDAEAQGRSDGHTGVSIDLQVRFSFRHRVTRSGKTRDLAVTPQITKLDLKVNHSIRLPSSYQDKSLPYEPLLYHEYDHVAISADQRPWLLLRYLIATMGVIHHSLPAGTPIRQTLICQMINDRIRQYKDAVLELVQANYDLLDSDEVSRHGFNQIPDRAAFFGSLYTRENLEQVNFPYTLRAARFLKSSTYRKAKRYYSE